MTEPRSTFYARVFALVTAALLGVALFKIIEPFIGAILWSVLLAFLLFPVNRSAAPRAQGEPGGGGDGPHPRGDPRPRRALHRSWPSPSHDRPRT